MQFRVSLISGCGLSFWYVQMILLRSNNLLRWKWWRCFSGVKKGWFGSDFKVMSNYIGCFWFKFMGFRLLLRLITWFLIFILRAIYVVLLWLSWVVCFCTWALWECSWTNRTLRWVDRWLVRASIGMSWNYRQVIEYIGSLFQNWQLDVGEWEVFFEYFWSALRFSNGFI